MGGLMKILKVVSLIIFGLSSSTPIQAENVSHSDLLRRSYQLEREGKYDGAIRALTVLYNTKRRDFFLNLRLGWLNYLNGNFKNALVHYENALSNKRHSMDAALGKVNTLIAE